MIDPVKAIQGVYAAVEKYNDVPLMKQIVDLQSQVMEQQTELASARQQLQAATDKLSLREKLTRRGPAHYYFLQGENDPLCPICWERDGRLVHLPPAERGAAEFAETAMCATSPTGKSRCSAASNAKLHANSCILAACPPHIKHLHRRRCSPDPA
jgi:hypothetical protein